MVDASWLASRADREGRAPRLSKFSGDGEALTSQQETVMKIGADLDRLYAEDNAAIDEQLPRILQLSGSGGASAGLSTWLAPGLSAGETSAASQIRSRAAAGEPARLPGSAGISVNATGQGLKARTWRSSDAASAHQSISASALSMR